MLKLIYGKSGSGKSTYIYENIKQTGQQEKVYLIVPEQSNLMAEQMIFKMLSVNSIFHVQVLTLSRLAIRVLEEVGGMSFTTINQSSKSMIIANILNREKDKLHFLGKSDKNIEIVSNMLTELKKHNITVNTLQQIEGLDTLTRLKMQDIQVIYQEYQKALEGNYIDENDLLTMISPKILESTIFDNAMVYIDDFQGFTPQEYDVFEKILLKARDVMVTIPANNLEPGDKDQDIFYFNKVFANRLMKIAKDNHVSVEELPLEGNKRAQNQDLQYLEKAFSSSAPIKLYEKVPENLKLFLANHSYSELEYVANEILRLVKEEHYHYNEIVIISNDLETYPLEAKVIFEKYQIPLFMDDKKDLTQNLLIKYVLAIGEIFAKNWSFDSVFNYVKLGVLQNISDEEIYLLENYCRKWGIKNHKWLKPFSMELKNDIQDRLEELRKQIIEPLVSLKEKMSYNKTAEELTKHLYDFVLENKISVILYEKLNKMNDIEITNEYYTSYKIFIEVLDSIVSLFGKQKMTFEEYKSLLQVGFSESEVGTIPATQDQVILGDSRRSRNNNIKACFIVGVNDGSFPLVNTFEGFLNDVDRENLKKMGVELAKTSVDAMYESNFEIYRIVTLPSEKLYVSYCSQSQDGKGLRPSILIKKIKRLYPKIEEKSDIIQKEYYITNKIATFDDGVAVYKEFLEGKTLTKEWKTALNYYYQTEKEKLQGILNAENYTNMSETISEQNIEKMYGKKLMGSVSKLEQYRTCPFAFHLKYGLKLKEKEECKMQSIETGTFMHEVIDTFFAEIEQNGISVKEIDEDTLKKMVNRIVEELLQTSKYYLFSSTAKFKTLTRKLKKVVLSSLQYIVYTLRNSDFDLYGHEIEFGNTSHYKPIIVELEDGKKVEIVGKIDRLDIGKLNDKTYVRIIDYKSKLRDLDKNKIEAGLQIQLITYLDAICKTENFEPAGILYSGLIDSKLKLKPGQVELEEEKIKAAIRKNFRMNGVVLADINIVKMMDKNLNSGVTSDIIPVGLTDNGNFNKRSSKVLEKEEFNELQTKVNSIIQEISREILKGTIDIKPYRYKNETGCMYCSYQSICRFNPNLKDNGYYYV